MMLSESRQRGAPPRTRITTECGNGAVIWPFSQQQYSRPPSARCSCTLLRCSRSLNKQKPDFPVRFGSDACGEVDTSQVWVQKGRRSVSFLTQQPAEDHAALDVLSIFNDPQRLSSQPSSCFHQLGSLNIGAIFFPSSRAEEAPLTSGSSSVCTSRKHLKQLINQHLQPFNWLLKPKCVMV